MNNQLRWLGIMSLAVLTFSVSAENLVIGYQTGVQPASVDQADGHFEKTLGKPITWRRFNSGPDVVAALASDSIQIGNLGSSPFAAAVSRRLPLVAFLVSTQINSAEALVVTKTSHIKSPQQLIGKTIATPFVSTSHYSLLAALKHWGIQPAQVNIVNLAPLEILAAWKRGDIDGAFVWSPALSAIEKEGRILADAKQVGQWGSPTFEVWVARQDFAAKHSEILTQFSQVVLNRFEDYQQHPKNYQAGSENVAKIAKLVGVPVEDVPALLAGSHYPIRQEQLSPALLGGGTAVATKATAQFLLQQKTIPEIQQSYQHWVSAEFISKDK